MDDAQITAIKDRLTQDLVDRFLIGGIPTASDAFDFHNQINAIADVIGCDLESILSELIFSARSYLER